MTDQKDTFQLSRHGDYFTVYSGGIQLGRRINKCSLETAGFLMLHVLSVTDDFLVFPADPEDLLPAACPKRRALSPQEAERMLAEAESHGLIARYECDGETWGVFLNAPPKRTKNGKHASRFPHPDTSVAVWQKHDRKWVTADSASASDASDLGESRKSRKSRSSNDNKAKQSKAIAEQSRTKQSSMHACSAACVEVLQRLGVDTGMMSRRKPENQPSPDVTPDEVIRNWLDINRREGVRNPQALLVTALVGPDRPERQPTLDEVYQAIQRGWIASISGRAVDNTVRRVPASKPNEIRIGAEIVLKRDQIREAVFE